MNTPTKVYERLDCSALDNVPPILKQGRRFVCWREVVRNGNPTKIPVDPHTGFEAKSDDPATWATFNEALAYYQAHCDTLQGIGRMFDPADGIMGIDFDKCLDDHRAIIPGTIADEWLPRFNSYSEASPSCKGVKVWVTGQHELGGKSGRRDSKLGVEIYRERRYFTITGKLLPQFSGKVEKRPTELDEFFFSVFGRKKTANGSSTPAMPTITTLTDAEIIRRAGEAKNGRKFQALWDGNIEGYGSQSEADAALCKYLWFRTGDREAVRRLFGQSALGQRSKWTDRLDYQEATLNLACKGEVYSRTNARPQAPAEATGARADEFLILPGGTVTITETATELFGRIAPTKTLFIRGGVVTELLRDQNGVLILSVVRPATARSLFEKHGRLMAWRSGAEGEPVLKPVVMAEDMAKALLECEVARHLLPRVDGLVNCPIIVGDGEMVGRGYHEPTRLLITGGEFPPTVKLSEAVASLKEVVEEIDFQTPGDRSRALASIITPALKIGGHLHGNIPADVAEADQSQAGKGYRQRVIAAIYNERVALVTQRTGGVGSTDETFDERLIAGRPFIQWDNTRGKQDSPHVEAFLTAERSFPARTPHRREVEIDPSRFFVLLTSNGVEVTKDFANRSSIIRIRKRVGYAFRKYPEGYLLDHVRARQSYYLGCVFVIVREWIRQGRQRTSETRHDFREWCQTLDWIVQNILGEAPLMDGHEAAQERVSNPDQTFLRKLALAVAEQDRLGETMIASVLYEIAEAGDVDIPRLKEPDEDKGRKQIGIVLGRLFKATDCLVFDGFTVTRHEVEVAREGGGRYLSKTYTFTRQEANSAQPAQPALDVKCLGKNPDFSSSIGSSAPCAPVQPELAPALPGERGHDEQTF